MSFFNPNAQSIYDESIFLFLAKAITIVTGLLLFIAPIVVLLGLFRCIYYSFCPNKTNKKHNNT